MDSIDNAISNAISNAANTATSKLINGMGLMFVCYSGFWVVMVLAAFLIFGLQTSRQIVEMGLAHFRQLTVSDLASIPTEHFVWSMRFLFVYNALSFFAAIAFLQRKNWARLLWVANLTFAILLTLAWLLFSFAAHLFNPEMQASIANMILPSVVSLLLSLFLGWLILRLLSEPMTLEFTRQKA